MLRNESKTKILATLGPATASIERLCELVDAGIDAVRLNFSHGSKDEFIKIFSLIDEVCKIKSRPIAVLQDLQGPKIRIGKLIQPEIEIQAGDSIEITTREVEGTKELISCSYKNLPTDASIGNTILIDDGLLELKVIEKKNDSVICEIIEGGTLKPKKGMNLPGMRLNTPSVTEHDLENLEFALKYRIDYIALSFVRHQNDIIELREWLTDRGYKKRIIAKIEKKEAVDNFEAILEAADGIMVARGDLGVELAPQAVPFIQKRIIRRCNELGKLVITATQMLESMIQNPVPTRAEASDVANAVWDGTDVVMLSGETSVGKFPVETVTIMNDILLSTESQEDFNSEINYNIPSDRVQNLFDATGRAVVDIADQIKAKVIVVFTHFGKKARTIAKFRPNARIIAISNSFQTMNELNLYWGIVPFFMKDIDDEDIIIEEAKELLIKNRLVYKDDVVLFTAGAPCPDKGRNSWLRSAVIE